MVALCQIPRGTAAAQRLQVYRRGMGAAASELVATVNLRPVTQWKRLTPMSGWHHIQPRVLVPPSIGHTGNARHGPPFTWRLEYGAT